MYAYMTAQGTPVAFQTATADKICGEDPCPTATWNQALQMAVDYGAGSVELPRTSNGYTSWPIDDPAIGFGLAHYDALLEA
jgi:hypothetical protein